MGSRVIIVIAAVVLAGGCSRPPAAPAFVDYRDEETGFIVRHPGGWVRDPMSGPREVRFVPAGAEGRPPAEFVSIFTIPAEGSPNESTLRRTVFNLLPIHGVSGFQQDPRTTTEVLWFKFDVTGSSNGVEWASTGVATADSSRTQVAICAKPLPAWRQGQRQCDEVIRSFQPAPTGP